MDIGINEWFDANPMENELISESWDSAEINLNQSTESNQQVDDNDNNALNISSLIDVIKHNWKVYANLMAVFFISYIGVYGLSDRHTMNNTSSSNFLERNGYVLVQVSYYLGNFIGRGTLHFFKFRYLSVPSLLSIGCVGGIYYMVYTEMDNVLVLVGVVLVLAISLGTNICQGMNLLIEDEKTQSKNKEVAIVMSSVLVDLAQVAGFVCCLLFATFVMPYSK